MQGYGTDRVRRGKGEQWIILSSRPKGWVPRTPATMTTRDRPGTAVVCEEKYYEVVAAVAVEGGVRYVLEPWRDEHVMRVVDAYDAASEAHREADHRDVLRRDRGRISANLLGLLTGQLPGPVQERMGNELGIWPARLTLISILPAMTVVGLVVNLYVHRRMVGEAPLPGWAYLLAGYLFFESALRFLVAMTQNRPLGSLAGFLAYSLYYLVTPGRKSLIKPIAAPRESMVPAVPEDVAAADRYHLLEPLLTLLPPADQARLAQRFGFDYRKMGAIVAAVILIFGILGAGTAIGSLLEGGGISPVLSLIVSGGLAAEQAVRLSKLRRGPAGSILGSLVRPLARRLVAPGVEQASHG